MKVQGCISGKTGFFLCLISLLGISVLHATPVCPSSGIFSTLESFGSSGCTIDGLVFSDFRLTPTVNGHVGSTSNGNAIAPNASHVDFNSIVSGTNGEFGFDFNSFTLSVLSPSATQTASLQIDYSVEAEGKQRIIDAGLTGSNALAVASGKGTKASTSIAETFSPPVATTCLSTVTNTNTCSFTVPGGSANDFVLFNNSKSPSGIPPDQILLITKTLTVTATGKGTDAFMSDLRNVVNVDTPVPEPGFYGVLLLGLTGIFLFAKRRKKTV
jgi:hypothetical protein